MNQNDCNILYFTYISMFKKSMRRQKLYMYE